MKRIDSTRKWIGREGQRSHDAQAALEKILHDIVVVWFSSLVSIDLGPHLGQRHIKVLLVAHLVQKVRSTSCSHVSSMYPVS